ncbi:hypothetical protein NL676_007044 [Syzygium grande]|nr:hypothetical protein NL676_007044 [Syzygium grande]
MDTMRAHATLTMHGRDTPRTIARPRARDHRAPCPRHARLTRSDAQGTALLTTNHARARGAVRERCRGTPAAAASDATELRPPCDHEPCLAGREARPRMMPKGTTPAARTMNRHDARHGDTQFKAPRPGHEEDRAREGPKAFPIKSVSRSGLHYRREAARRSASGVGDFSILSFSRNGKGCRFLTATSGALPDQQTLPSRVAVSVVVISER